mmetsp:Transcript_119850/g.208027  ORF Transcript_119850/g.208027 Transcript_119850/m.208027 type:complete len:225 (-) Transcript_119850:48-722(-)
MGQAQHCCSCTNNRPQLVEELRKSRSRDMSEAGYIHHHDTGEDHEDCVSKSKVPPLVFEEARPLGPDAGEILLVREGAPKEQAVSALPQEQEASDDQVSLCDELPNGRTLPEVMNSAYAVGSPQNPVTEEASTFYTIQLDKKASKHDSLGLEIDRTDDVVLVVVKIGAGYISDWNDRNPGKQVELGDIILKVNGLSGDAKKMVALCRSEDKLEMLIKKALRSGG